MNYYGKIAVLSIGLLFIGVSLFGLDISSAQTNKPQNAAASPTPPASPTPVIEEENDIIKIDTEVVNVLFTAQDKNRRLLTDLKQSDVRLLEDGQPQEITAFARQVDLPLSLAILIDTSASQERT
ncbi:MAG: hypothetical protein LC768_01275, partial [Acidobacteria bacterium]|nr:hypothetical protein [Acidobacteriota bacterium]